MRTVPIQQPGILQLLHRDLKCTSGIHLKKEEKTMNRIRKIWRKRFILVTTLVLISEVFFVSIVCADEISKVIDDLKKVFHSKAEVQSIMSGLPESDRTKVIDAVVYEFVTRRDEIKKDPMKGMPLFTLLENMGDYAAVAMLEKLHNPKDEAVWAYALAVLVLDPKSHMISPERISGFIPKMLGSSLSDNRIVATMVLGTYAMEEHTQILIDRFTQEKDKEVKREMALTLAKLDNEKSLAVTVSNLKSSDADIRHSTCIGLAGTKDHKIPLGLLIELVKTDPEKRVRFTAIEAIVMSQDAVTALPFFKETIDDAIQKGGGPETLFFTAISNVWKIRTKETVALLASYLDSNDSSVRFKSVLSLGKTGLKEAIPILLRATNDTSFGVRSQAIESLGWIGDTSVLPELEKLSEKEDTRESARKAIQIIKSGGKKWD